MDRDVVGKLGDNMAVVDTNYDLWGKKRYKAGVLKIKMVPKIWCETVGTFTSEAEARAAAIAALTNGEQ